MASRSKNSRIIAVAIVAALVIAGIAAAVWYLNQPVPEEVSLEEAVEDVATTVAGTEDDVAKPGDDIDGVWSVDTSLGDFSFEDASSSFVGFRIDEELTTIGATTAVGRTPAVSGTFTLAGSTITDAVIEADMTEIVTNADRRNRAVQRALDTGTHPTATFVLSTPIDLGAVPEIGEAIATTASGELTIKGVTQPIEIPLEAEIVPLSSDPDPTIIAVVGSVEIAFADWGVDVPSAPVVVSAEDHGILELQLFFTRS